MRDMCFPVIPLFQFFSNEKLFRLLNASNLHKVVLVLVLQAEKTFSFMKFSQLGRRQSMGGKGAVEGETYFTNSY